MRILFCGDREWRDEEAIMSVMKTLKDQYGDFEVIHGVARGADSIAGECAKKLGLGVIKYPAHWTHTERCAEDCGELTGRRAGPIRNRKMLSEGKPHMVCAFHSDLLASKGTKDMVHISKKAGLRVCIFTKESK